MFRSEMGSKEEEAAARIDAVKRSLDRFLNNPEKNVGRNESIDRHDLMRAAQTMFDWCADSRRELIKILDVEMSAGHIELDLKKEIIRSAVHGWFESTHRLDVIAERYDERDMEATIRATFKEEPEIMSVCFEVLLDRIEKQIEEIDVQLQKLTRKKDRLLQQKTTL